MAKSRTTTRSPRPAGTTRRGAAGAKGSAKAGSSKRSGSARSAKADGKQLVIVESPAKARTINKYLGSGYVVMACVGHVRDLPKRNPKGVDAPVPGVDLDHDFQPTYEIIQGKGKTIADLKRAARSAEGVWLATDLDREGEAIAWHLVEALGLDADRVSRVVFNAITREDIHRAFESPHRIDTGKVNAQQARRILDRIVGYQVSPLLWKKVAGGLSAGRVQSVATRLIVEREREIGNFVPAEYWKITGYFTPDVDRREQLAGAWRDWLAQAAPNKNARNGRNGSGPSVRDKLAWLAEHQALMAVLVEVGGQKFEPKNVDEALSAARLAGFELRDQQAVDDPKGKGPAAARTTLVGELTGSSPDWHVKSIDIKRTTSRPSPPFITSTLQQAAANRLGFATNTTMRLAQQLYEGVDVKGQGSVGLITYMRTDSTHLSNEALGAARSYIGQQFGDQYLPDKANVFTSSTRDAQEAHEAIRPTEVNLQPDDPTVRASLTDQQHKLYKLIWDRFISCQMSPAEWDATTVHIAGQGDGKELLFKASGRVLVFDGYYKVAGVPHPADEAILPKLSEQQPVAPLQIDPTQNFTAPPARYTEASLVRKLESEGIGRPSTYADIIQKIQARRYVEKTSGRFGATDLGEVVTDKLIEAFPQIMDVGYTRQMESELDAVEEQHHDWIDMLHKFYNPFKNNLEQAHEGMAHAKAETRPAPDEYKCPDCGAGTVYRFGRNGRFLSCSRYPECKHAAPVDREGKPQSPEETDIACPKCSAAMQLRTGRYGPFLSCPRYPECDGVVNLDRKGHVKHPSPPPVTTDMDCPKCGEPLNLRRSKRGPWLSCSAYPKCRGRAAWSKLEAPVQNKWLKALTEHEKAHPQPVIKTVDGRDVGDTYKPIIAGDEADDDGADLEVDTHEAA